MLARFRSHFGGGSAMPPPFGGLGESGIGRANSSPRGGIGEGRARIGGRKAACAKGVGSGGNGWRDGRGGTGSEGLRGWQDLSVHARRKAYGLTSIELRERGNEGEKVIGERLPRNERNKLDVKRFSWYRERVPRRDIEIVLPGGGLTVAFSRLLSALFSGAGFSAPRVTGQRYKQSQRAYFHPNRSSRAIFHFPPRRFFSFPPSPTLCFPPFFPLSSPR